MSYQDMGKSTDDLATDDPEANNAPPAAGEELPTYDEATGPNDAPPTYDALFGKIKDARENSSNAGEFVLKLMAIVFGTLCCSIVFLLMSAVPIAMIAIGAIYLHQCPVEHYIPIYLIVAGAFSLIRSFISSGKSFKQSREPTEEPNEQRRRLDPFGSLISLFLFCWFIAGNVWIYGNYTKVDMVNATSTNYCHETLYLFSFWVTNVMYIMMGLCCCCVCCACVWAGVAAKISG